MRFAGEIAQEVVDREPLSREPLGEDLPPAPPGRHQREDDDADGSGNQPPSLDLDDVRAEEREVDDQEDGTVSASDREQRSSPSARAPRRRAAAS